MLKKIKALAAAALILIICAGSVYAEDNTADQTDDGISALSESGVQAAGSYKTVAENHDYRLLADLETGDFALEELDSGRLWYSGQWDVLDENHPASELNSGRIKTDLVSSVAVNFVQLSTIAGTAVPSYQNSYAYCVLKDNVTVTGIENGFRAEYYFEDIDSTVPLEITLTDSGFSAAIIGEDISMGDEYWITSIELLPGFMAGDDRLEGYIFVPSGSGGLIPLNSGKGDLAVYSEMVYGDDAAIEEEEYTGESRNILVPVYGLKYGDGAVTAVISEGDTSARIRAEADSLTSSFSRVFSEYVTAITDSTTLFESNYENQRVIYGVEQRESFSDYRVDYTFLSGSSATYAGMAQVYREYISLESSAEPPQLYMTLYGAATRKASFLGIPYTKTFSLTTFDEAEEIVSEMNEEDIPVSLQYVGWNNSGIENKKVPSKFSPVGVLGGKSGFEDFDGFINSNDNSVFYDLDFLSIRKSSWGFSALSDVCKSIFNTRTPQYKYMRSVYVPVNTENPWYILKPASFEKAADKFFGKFKYQSGVSLAVIGDTLYSDFSENGSTRADTAESYKKVMGETAAGREIAVNVGNAYTYAFADRIYSLPMTNDGNLLFECSVPFVQMVLHGSISYGAETSSTLLDCIEYGANPYYAGIAADDSTLIETSFNWLGGTSYENWADEAKTTFKSYSEVYKDLYNKQIVGHSESNGVSQTVFEDGTVIYVNRTESTVSVGGIQIEPYSFGVSGGEQQ